MIPREIRQDLGLKSGQIVQVFAKGGVITIVPDRPVGAMKGFLKGLRTHTLREKKDWNDSGTSLSKPGEQSGDRVKRA